MRHSLLEGVFASSDPFASSVFSSGSGEIRQDLAFPSTSFCDDGISSPPVVSAATLLRSTTSAGRKSVGEFHSSTRKYTERNVQTSFAFAEPPELPAALRPPRYTAELIDKNPSYFPPNSRKWSMPIAGGDAGTTAGRVLRTR